MAHRPSHRCAVREEVIGSGEDPTPASHPEVQLSLPGRQPLPLQRPSMPPTSASSWAEPRCSIEREPAPSDHTICTAVAPEVVFTVRT